MVGKTLAFVLAVGVTGCVGFAVSNIRANKDKDVLNNTIHEQQEEISDLHNSLNENTALNVLLNEELQKTTLELETNKTALAEKETLLASAKAEIEQLKQDNSVLESDLEDKQARITELETQVATLQSENANLQAQIDFLQSQLDELQKISFTVLVGEETLEFNAKEGMTWGEWVESSFNTYNFTLDEYGYIIDNTIYTYIYEGDVQVTAEMTITNGTSYLSKYSDFNPVPTPDDSELTLTNVTSLATVTSDGSDWFNDPSKVVDGDITTGNSSTIRSNSMSYTFEFEDILEIYKVKVYMNSGGTATNGTTYEAGATPIPKMQITAYNMNDEVFNSGEIDTSDMTILETLVNQSVNKVVITILQVGYSMDKVIYEVELFQVDNN